MFKNSENSTIVINVYDVSVIERGLLLANQYNINRLIVNCSSLEECTATNGMIPDLMDMSIWCRISKEHISKEVPSYENIGVIVCTNQKSGIEQEAPNVFWEIDLKLSELPDLRFMDRENVIWHMEFHRSEWDAFDKQLRLLIDGYETNDLMIDNVLVPLDLIKEHPCNVYLCDGKHCHSGHGRVPRYILLDAKGDMYPYGIIKEELKIGNVFFDGDIIKKYEQSESFGNFIRLNRDLYLQLIDKCNYSVIPWFDILGEM